MRNILTAAVAAVLSAVVVPARKASAETDEQHPRLAVH